MSSRARLILTIEYVASYMEVHLVLMKHLSPPPSIFKFLAESDNKLWPICDALK